MLGIMDGARERVTREPRTQEVLAPMPRYSNTPRRFWAQVEFTDTCWLWTGYRNRKGYGLFSYYGRNMPVHRYAYEFCIGPIPAGLQIDHLCRVHNCVYAWHLEPVTHLENVRRGMVGQWEKAKTHCPKGHPYSGKNLRVRTGGRYGQGVYRVCRMCQRDNRRARMAKR
jgi:hypothetical protein